MCIKYVYCIQPFRASHCNYLDFSISISTCLKNTFRPNFFFNVLSVFQLLGIPGKKKTKQTCQTFWGGGGFPSAQTLNTHITFTVQYDMSLTPRNVSIIIHPLSRRGPDLRRESHKRGFLSRLTL